MSLEVIVQVGGLVRLEPGCEAQLRKPLPGCRGDTSSSLDDDAMRVARVARVVRVARVARVVRVARVARVARVERVERESRELHMCDIIRLKLCARKARRRKFHPLMQSSKFSDKKGRSLGWRTKK